MKAARTDIVDNTLDVNPEAAKATPFGGTIAHGLLTLSMVPVMAYQAMPGYRQRRWR